MNWMDKAEVSIVKAMFKNAAKVAGCKKNLSAAVFCHGEDLEPGSFEWDYELRFQVYVPEEYSPVILEYMDKVAKELPHPFFLYPVMVDAGKAFDKEGYKVYTILSFVYCQNSPEQKDIEEAEKHEQGLTDMAKYFGVPYSPEKDEEVIVNTFRGLWDGLFEQVAEFVIDVD